MPPGSFPPPFGGGVRVRKKNPAPQSAPYSPLSSDKQLKKPGEKVISDDASGAIPILLTSIGWAAFFIFHAPVMVPFFGIVSLFLAEAIFPSWRHRTARILMKPFQTDCKRNTGPISAAPRAPVRGSTAPAAHQQQAHAISSSSGVKNASISNDASPHLGDSKPFNASDADNSAIALQSPISIRKPLKLAFTTKQETRIPPTPEDKLMLGRTNGAEGQRKRRGFNL